MDFDPSLQETRISARWLDDVGRKVWIWMHETEQHIFKRLLEIKLTDDARESIRRMLSRASLLVATIAGLEKLHRAHAAPLIVRSLFELAAQFEYLMQESKVRGERYLAFGKLTRKLRQDATLRAPGDFGELIRKSSMRMEGQARVDAEFESVKHFFQKPGKKGFQSNWYGMSIWKLMEALGKDKVDWIAEYEVFYANYSAWAHGDAFATDQDRPDVLLKSGDWLIHCYVYYARMLLTVAENGQLMLSVDQYEGLKNLAKGLLRI